MKKKRRIGIFASAIATMAICASLVVGATFALFTSESSVDITVKAGKVDVSAVVVNEEITDGVAESSVTYDEKTKKLAIENIVPGATVSFGIEVTNNGSVTAKYQPVLTCESGYALMSRFLVSMEGPEESVYTNAEKVKSMRAAYKEIEPKATETYSVTLEMVDEGSEIDNKYQGLSTEISATVFAVQGNAAITGEAAVESLSEITDATELTEALTAGGEYFIANDVEFTAPQNNLSVNEDLTLDIANGVTVHTNACLNVQDGATLTVNGGNWGSDIEYPTTQAFKAIGNAAGTKVILNNVNLTSQYYGVAIVNWPWVNEKAEDQPYVEINDSTITCKHIYGCAMGTDGSVGGKNEDGSLNSKTPSEEWVGKVLYTGGKVVMNRVEINSKGAGVMLTVPVDLILNECTVNAGMQGAVIRSGNATFNKCTFNINRYENEDAFEAAIAEGANFTWNVKNPGYVAKKYLADRNPAGTTYELKETDYWGSSNNTEVAAFVLGNRVSHGGATETPSYGFDCTITLNDTVVNQTAGVGEDKLVYIYGDYRRANYKANFNCVYSADFNGTKLTSADVKQEGKTENVNVKF